VVGLTTENNTEANKKEERTEDPQKEIHYSQLLKSFLSLIRSYKNGKLNQQRVAQRADADVKNKC
jgi:hypothetical protein